MRATSWAPPARLGGRAGWKAGPAKSSGDRPPPTSCRKRISRPGIYELDYAANFEGFFANRDESKPFLLWLGTSEPHQQHDIGAWRRTGKRLEDVRLPGALPDRPEGRGEILEYGIEIEHFDCP